jgi:two-component system sensor histidine kinase KdpD
MMFGERRPSAEHGAVSSTFGMLLWTGTTPGPLLRYLYAAAVVAAGTLLAELLYRTFGVTRLSPVFLGAVLLAALQLGRGPGLFSAVLAFLVYNFYLVEPRFTFQFASDDLLTLALFLAVALVTGSLAGRVRDEVLQRRTRERTLSTLFDASRLMSATESEAVLRNRIAEAVATAAGSYAAVVGDDGSLHTYGSVDGSPTPEDLVREVAQPVLSRPAGTTRRTGLWRVRSLRADENSFGAVVWRAPENARRGAEAEGLISVLVDLGGAAVARARLSAAKAELEGVTRAEQLRTALLSSVSHDFRTPLAAIMASASSLLEYGNKLEPAVRRDLLENIQEEAERLNRFVANLLNMTRLESGALDVRTEPVPVRETIDRVLRRLERRCGARKLTHLVTTPDLVAEADPVLLEQALTNIAENAIHYTPDGSEVTVWADEVDGAISIEVTDEGEGIPTRDLPRVFDKFYRVAQPRSAAQGAGLGLSIARGLIEAMEGRVTAGGRLDGRKGLNVAVRLRAASAA